MSPPEHSRVFVVRWWNPHANSWYTSRDLRTLAGAEDFANHLGPDCVPEIWQLSGDWQEAKP